MAIVRLNICFALFVNQLLAELLLFVNSKFQANLYYKNYFLFFKATAKFTSQVKAESMVLFLQNSINFSLLMSINFSLLMKFTFVNCFSYYINE